MDQIAKKTIFNALEDVEVQRTGTGLCSDEAWLEAIDELPLPFLMKQQLAKDFGYPDLPLWWPLYVPDTLEGKCLCILDEKLRESWATHHVAEPTMKQYSQIVPESWELPWLFKKVLRREVFYP